MVNKDMNGFPVKKCSAFQFFKKRVRRWIKSPMVSMEKHQNTNLKYTGSTVMHIPQGEPELESSLCQTCLGDHSFQQGIVPQEAESCSWESHRSCKMKESCSKGDLLAKPDPRTFWNRADSASDDAPQCKPLWYAKKARICTSTAYFGENSDAPTNADSVDKNNAQYSLFFTGPNRIETQIKCFTRSWFFHYCFFLLFW
ncbi:unnamed protein product [Eretmochelys imbricata]